MQATLNTTQQGAIAKMFAATYSLIGLGLLISGLSAYAFYSVTALNTLMYTNTTEGISFTLFGWVVLLAPIGLILLIASMREAVNTSTYLALYLLFTFIEGISLSAVFMRYELGSIVSCFFVTAGVFLAMAFVGAKTNRDLSPLGSFLYAMLIGLILATVVNMFLGSSLLDYAISLIGIALFSALTAYDTQKIKAAATGGYCLKSATDCALSLFLNFVNLLLLVLRLMGTSKD